MILCSWIQYWNTLWANQFRIVRGRIDCINRRSVKVFRLRCKFNGKWVASHWKSQKSFLCWAHRVRAKEHNAPILWINTIMFICQLAICCAPNAIVPVRSWLKPSKNLFGLDESFQLQLHARSLNEPWMNRCRSVCYLEYFFFFFDYRLKNGKRRMKNEDGKMEKWIWNCFEFNQFGRWIAKRNWNFDKNFFWNNALMTCISVDGFDKKNCQFSHCMTKNTIFFHWFSFFKCMILS